MLGLKHTFSCSITGFSNILINFFQNFLTQSHFFSRNFAISSNSFIYLINSEFLILDRYTNYTFIYNENGTKLANVNRYTPDSALGIIFDIYFLGRSDYVVCTMSSTVCRIVYELMQDRFGDASWRFRSLDDYFYVHRGEMIRYAALYDHLPSRHNPEEELEVWTGDTVVFMSYEYTRDLKCNGYAFAKNLRTGKHGRIPKYKVINELLIQDSPKCNLNKKLQVYSENKS
jgi:hypothetical protein